MPTHAQPSSTCRQLFRVDRKAVCFIRFIFEGYDGIALVETMDPHAACIALHVAPGCEQEAAAVMADLSREHRIEPVAVEPVNRERGCSERAKGA